jgi:hypothetical protein
MSAISEISCTHSFTGLVFSNVQQMRGNSLSFFISKDKENFFLLWEVKTSAKDDQLTTIDVSYFSSDIFDRNAIPYNGNKE